MAPPEIIDSHIHLWPESAANNEAHAWMSPGFSLAKQHVLEDYRHAAKQDSDNASQAKVRGVIYIETDRRYGERGDQDLHQWALQPTEELKFLRSIVEKQYGTGNSEMLLGLVPWAPMDQGIDVFEDWLKHAEQIAGSEVWQRVKGFRFLLQAITDRKQFESLVFSHDFISILRSFRSKSRNFSFDVGIDQHSGGAWQLEAFVKVMQQVHEGIAEDSRPVFILNHLCKPDLMIAPANPQPEEYKRWCDSIKRFSQFPNVYMKLSGAFSELATERMEPASPEDIAQRLAPWLDYLFACFPPTRIMFGSDWPVCNIRGPLGEDSWSVWHDVVKKVMDQRGLSDAEQQSVWSGSASEAYRLRL